jgi:hypothetical protein
LPAAATKVDGVEGHVSITHNRARAISNAIIMVITVMVHATVAVGRASVRSSFRRVMASAPTTG